MIAFTKIYFFVFAALTAAGGLMGFLKAGSKPSLIAGVVSGILLALAGNWLSSKTTLGAVMGVVVSVLLLGRFLPAYLKKGVVMPAVPMILLSVVGLVLGVLVLSGKGGQQPPATEQSTQQPPLPEKREDAKP